MICFNCGSALSPEVTDKCTICGMKLSIKCPSCSNLNPKYANYCFNCGTSLINIGDQFPSVKVENVLSDSRKNVAVIFADVSGFTALSEKRDPEEVRDIINECFEYITKPVYNLEGTIDKYIGDCVMILFGARYTHEDDPLRAVMCALEMIDLIKSFSHERLSSYGIDLTLSIGINYGLVVTGKVGNYYDKDYTVLGDVVNTAQRLQSHASSGTILVSESVYMETMDMVEYSPASEIVVKNKEKPIKCYEPKLLLQKLDKDSVCLIERDNELVALENLCNFASGSSTVYIIGDQGVGKTSLVKKFTASLPYDKKCIWNICSIQYHDIPYRALSSTLYTIMNISRDANPDTKAGALKSYIGYLFKDDEPLVLKNYYFLGFLLGLHIEKDFEDVLRSMKYDDINRELTSQVKLFFSRVFTKKSYIIILENFHWIDKQSRDLFIEVMQSHNSGSSMFIVTSRLANETLAEKQNIIQINNLSEAGTGKLACHLLGSENADSSFWGPLISITKGNPLYIKEYVKALKRSGKVSLLNGTLYLDHSFASSMPSSIEGLVQSRLSELTPACLEFLQTASVLGTEFNVNWVSGVLNNNFAENDVINLSVKLNFISFKEIETKADCIQRIYSFTDSMIRDVLYSSLLNREKKNKHKNIAEYIETAYGKELEDYYPILGYHFLKSDAQDKAQHYYYMAAERYKALFLYSSSLEYFRKCMDILQEGNLPDKEIILSAIHYEIGSINLNLGMLDDALEHLNQSIELNGSSEDIYSCQLLICSIYKEKGMYEDALNLLGEIQPKIRENSSLYGRLLQLKCSIYSITSNKDALKLAEESEHILLKNKDFDSLSETMNQAGLIYFCSSDIENAIYYLNKAYEYAEKINNLAAVCRSSSDLGVVYHYSGRVSRAEEYFLKSLDISKKISNVKSFIYTSINLGILYMDKGFFVKARDLFENSLQEAKKSSLMYPSCVARLNLGDVYYEEGHYHLSLKQYSEALSLSKDHKLGVEEGISYISLSKLHYKMKNYNVIVELLEKAYGIFNETGELSYLCDYYKLKSKLDLNNNDPEQALRNCDLAIDNSIETQNDINKLKCLRLKGIILSLLLKPDDALACFDESIKLAVQLQSDYELAKSYYRKCKVLQDLGRVKAAADCNSLSIQAIGKVDYCRWTDIIKNS